MVEQKQENKDDFKHVGNKVSEHSQKSQDDFRHFIRIANTDLDGNLSIKISLTKVKGVSFQFAHIVCSVLKIDPAQKTGYLDDQTAKRIEELLKDPVKFNIPNWVFNRRKDYQTGDDQHLLTSDLDLTKENDIKRMKMIKSYKGSRHAKGLPVRGQKTKSNFRRNKGKGSLGVKRKAGAKSGKT